MYWNVMKDTMYYDIQYPPALLAPLSKLTKNRYKKIIFWWFIALPQWKQWGKIYPGREANLFWEKGKSHKEINIFNKNTLLTIIGTPDKSYVQNLTEAFSYLIATYLSKSKCLWTFRSSSWRSFSLWYENKVTQRLNPLVIL